MSAISLPFSLPGCVVTQVQTTDHHVAIDAHTDTTDALCPDCQHPSARVHSRYWRQLRDLPVSAAEVTLRLHVCRFFCDQPACCRRTFAERLPTVAPRHAQRTLRLTTTLRQLGLAVGGQAGARLARQLRMPTSGATLLRVLRATTLPAFDPPRVIGIDDFALQKRRRYGTLVVDLERHRPIDLLADRSATTVSTWLQHHPEVVVVARDRAPDYRHGTTEGAPMATQVADRFHLVCNLREAVERALQRRMADLRALLRAQPTPEQSPILQDVVDQPPPRRYARQPGRQKIQEARRATREAQHAEAKRLRAVGLTHRQIAQRVGRCCQTIQRWLCTDQAPQERRGYRGPAKIDAYVDYLQQRLAEGCINQTQLWQEICAQGFTGSRSLVSKWTRAQPDHREKQPSRLTLPSAKDLSWMVMRPVSDHTDDEAAVWGQLSAYPDLAVLTTVTQHFLTMLREHHEDQLELWIAACQTSGIAEIRHFAEGIERDGAAVRAAIQLPWSTGPVEGQINRLKSIKRSGYGRMKLDLLRIRVLAAA